MARRKRSRVSEFMQGFEDGYDTIGKVIEDVEMSKIAKAAPEASEGFTADQGAQLEAAAKSGQYDIGYDEAAKAYTVTPKADPSQVGRIAQQGVTDFLGNRTAGTMNEGQVDRARTMAQAGVIGRRDPNEAMKLRQSVKAGEREDQRWDRQTKEWERTDQDRAREEQYRTDRERLLQESPIAQYRAVTQKYEGDMAAYNEALKSGKTPDEIGPPPEKPNVQRPGPLQTMAGYAKLIEHDYKYGKLNTDGLINFQEKMGNIEKENYVKALQAAQAGGSPEQVAKAFNAAGMQIDPKNVTITKTKQANGPDLVTLNYKDEKGQAASIPVMAELEAYGQAKQVYDRFYNSEQNRRGNEQLQLSKNADARAGAAAARTANESAQEKKDKQAKADAAEALFRERNPNATAAELEAVRRGILEAVPTADKNAPAEVKLAQAYRRAGLAKDDAEALRMATQSKSDSPEKTRAEIYGKALAANFGNAEAAKKATEEAMSYLMPAAPAPAPAPASVTPRAERKVGEEREVTQGANKGKRVRWDGSGWVVI